MYFKSANMFWLWIMHSTVHKYPDFHYIVLKFIYLNDAKCSEGPYIHLLLSIDSNNLAVFPSPLA